MDKKGAVWPADIEIAQNASIKNIAEVASALGIPEEYVETYGRYKAKIDTSMLKYMEDKQRGKLILVTAITPTPAGEGKTTVTVGLADGLRRIGKNSVVALREPSLGPVFGVKGGAAGGGYAQVVPMEDINLHFTGDIHAVTAANNLLAAMLDNHIHHGNALDIDVRRISWRRCLDMNDRQLRSVVCGIGGKNGGVPREEGFQITAASEVMACLCLAAGLRDLEERLGRIVVGYSRNGSPVTASQLGAHGAMAALLRDAVRPNLVQTLEHTPAFIHGGPFANIAHGCNSVIATRMALALGDYAVTEAGFGADLGAEKVLDIKCRVSGLRPDAVVLVATVRALKHHGGVAKADFSSENPVAVLKGMPNLLRHADNLREVFGLPVVVAVNRFASDHDSELEALLGACRERGLRAAMCEVFEKGGEGGRALAEEVVRLCDEPNEFAFAYPDDIPLREKLEALVRRVYRGSGLTFAPGVKKQLEQLELHGFGRLPVCLAKTQYSFSDNPALACAPEGFRVTVREVRVSAGAGFVVALAGDIMTMPGLPKIPSAENIRIAPGGGIEGLF